MKLGIMQPYFLPYIGYWQLLNYVDTFVIYDNIQYTKKGWVNRNRYCENEYITLTLENDSHFLGINERWLSKDWEKQRSKILRKARYYYKECRCFDEGMSILDLCLPKVRCNLFTAIYNQIFVIYKYLSIKTPIVVASDVKMDHTLKGAKRVLAMCKAMCADKYINPIGGIDLYNKQHFWDNSVRLNFLKAKNIMYPRVGKFYPYMSVIDIIFHCEREQILNMLNQYEIL